MYDQSRRDNRRSSAGRGRGDPPPRSVGAALDKLWPDYLAGGYFDDQGNLRTELVAREKVEPLVQSMAGRDAQPKALTSGQLRRFFQHCRGVEMQLKTGGATWPQVRDRILFLDAAASDALGKTQQKIPRLFYDFIRRNVAAIKSERDFLRGFMPHFEALVGFGSLHLQRERT